MPKPDTSYQRRQQEEEAKKKAYKAWQRYMKKVERIDKKQNKPEKKKKKITDESDDISKLDKATFIKVSFCKHSHNFAFLLTFLTSSLKHHIHFCQVQLEAVSKF